MALGVTTGFSNNTSTLKDTQDYGLKVAKAGYDALTAPEAELLFNSSWPSLQIVAVKEITFDEFGSSNPIAHGMPFKPLCMLVGTMTFVSGPIGIHNNNRPLTVDSTYAYPQVNTSNATVQSARVIIYNVNITVDVEYPYKDRGGISVNYDADYGIKSVKDGLDITSDNLRDYAMHSRCQSPMLLAVKTQETIPAGNVADNGFGDTYRYIQYTSPLDFISYAFGFVQFNDTDTYTYAPYLSQAYPALATDGATSQLILIDGTSDKGSIVVLRSPMFSETNEYTVSY